MLAYSIIKLLYLVINITNYVWELLGKPWNSSEWNQRAAGKKPSSTGKGSQSCQHKFFSAWFLKIPFQQKSKQSNDKMILKFIQRVKWPKCLIQHWSQVAKLDFGQ